MQLVLDQLGKKQSHLQAQLAAALGQTLFSFLYLDLDTIDTDVGKSSDLLNYTEMYH